MWKRVKFDKLPRTPRGFALKGMNLCLFFISFFRLS